MMLRSKATNVQQAPVETRQKRKQEATIHKNAAEPAPKKSICELSTGIQDFAIDSSKRSARGNDENIKPGVNAEVVLKKDVYVDPCPNFDYDKEEAHNPDSVPEYASDIFRYYKSREKVFRVGDYLTRHPELDIKARAILVDWLVEVQESFELNHETLYNAVKIVDLYLTKSQNVTKDVIQLVATAAIFIAAKYDERSAPYIDDLIILASDRFDRTELMAMERTVFATIDFDLGAPLSYRYLRRLARVSFTDMATLTLARYILECSLLVYDYALISASRIASAAFLLAMRMKNPSYQWNAILEKYSGYTKHDIEPLMQHLNHTVQFLKNRWNKLSNIHDKYSHAVFFEAALVPLPPYDGNEDPNQLMQLPRLSFP